MENKPEEQKPQNTSETAVPADTVTLSKQELDDLKHKAEVSSQNFERLKKAEQEAEELRTQLADNSLIVENEDEVVGKLKNEVSEIKQKLHKSEVLESYPQLKEVWKEFESFREEPDNKGMNLKTSAKAFLVEKGLLEKQRIGLEKPTGGGHAPISSGMSSDEVAKLRDTNYREYVRKLRNGDIKIS